MLRCLRFPTGNTEAILRVITTPHPRHVSSSPYGRAHVWKSRKPKLPNPIVPKFPQTVTLSDGSTFTHYITSPRSSIRLTRDTTNNPLWNYGTGKGGGMFEDEQTDSGRMGRFQRRFEEFSGDLDWVVEESSKASEVDDVAAEGEKKE